MPECSYCGERFDDEETHLSHLAEEHDDELGPIDRRRVDAARGGGGWSTRQYAAVAVAVGLAAVAAYALFASPGSSGPGATPADIESEPLPEEGDQRLLADVQSFPSQGAQHVPPGTDVDYETMPPTSGAHYQLPAEPGYYEEMPELGNLVHALEHGAVVIYYDPAALDGEAEASLRAFADAHTDDWAYVVVTPHPESDPDDPYVLTAWRHMLRLSEYDAETVRAFLAEFLGRGPENPVR